MAVEQYRQYIQQLLTEKVQRTAHNLRKSQVEKELIFDVQRDRYQLVHVDRTGAS